MAPLTLNTGIDQLFGQYIDIVNQAIATNREEFYGKVIELWERAFGEERIALGVYERDASDPHSWYTIELCHGRFTVVDGRKDPAAKYSTRIKRSYLEGVVEDPEMYVEHPLKLDLDWLKSRIESC